MLEEMICDQTDYASGGNGCKIFSYICFQPLHYGDQNIHSDLNKASSFNNYTFTPFLQKAHIPL